MTHDELLAKVNAVITPYIEKHPDGYYVDEYLLGAINALSAVVELHEGYIINTEVPDFFACKHCEWSYPCPTIESIEKELK